MSIDTTNIPESDRGREKVDPTQNLRRVRSKAPIPRRFVLHGTQGPLARLTPDPPTVLTVKFRNDQAGISDYVSNAIRALWDAHINPDEFSASWKDLGPIIKVIIAQHYAGSAADAAEYYRNMHVVGGLMFPRVIPAPFDGAHLQRMAGSVANGTFYHQLNTQGLPAGRASEIARNTMSGAGARFALNGARNTVIRSVANDPDAMGWDRLIEPDACSYCAAQAAKGPFKPLRTGFRAHDWCKCLAIPALRGSSMPDPNSALRMEWNKITGTFTGQEARAAWDKSWRENGNNIQNPSP